MIRILAVALLSICVATAYGQAPPAGQTGQTGQTSQGQSGRGQTAPGGQRGRGMQRPREAARDANRTAATGTAVISGRVLAADTGRPIKRARVILSGGGRPFSAVTDEQGRYRIAALPPATYTITATKAGFVDSGFGERRAQRQGTPIQLADGQQLANIDLKLPRGGVITGVISDEDGEPLARTTVSVMRYQYVRGERQMMPAGVDQTDDRGQYRVFGLAPGEYYVSATAGGALENLVRNFLDAATPPASPATPTETTGYAPTYYPGVIAATSATQLKVGAGQELAGIDFQVQLVPLATVRGIVSGGNATVMLIPAGVAAGGGGGGIGGGRGGPSTALRAGGRGGLAELASGILRGSQTLRANVQADGSFTIRNVPPGNYTIVARSNGPDAGAGNFSRPQTAVQPLVVSGEEVTVALTPAPGATLSGTITLEAAGTKLPQLSAFRVTPDAVGVTASLPRGGRPGTADDRGNFSITDVMPGHYLIRATGPRGWMMKTVYADGRDVTDEPIEVKGTALPGLNIIFTDRISTVTGTVRDARGAAAANVHVVAFPSDENLWHPQSRFINAARTDVNGAYRLSGLPPGSYLVAVAVDAEQGEWFDPAFLEQLKNAAAKVTLGEGEQRSLDFRTPS